ncbi:MAG: 50S ribosomal protein L7/L12 [Planctomycetota bacterium]
MAEETATESGPKEYSGKVQKILDALKDFTLMDLKELKDAYEETFDVQAAGIPMAAMPMAGAAPAAEAAAAEEPTIFNLILKEIGSKKIQVIKAVRELTGFGLKEAKELVDSAAQGPAKVKENLTKDEGETAKKKLEEAGAVIALDPA